MRWRLFAAIAAHDVKEVIKLAIFGVYRDEGAAPLLTHDNFFRDQLVDCLADRADRNFELSRKLGLAWNRRAGLPLAGDQAARDSVFDFFIKRLRSGAAA